ncbi:glycosyltransferase family 4 protein [Achromobacter seleniivolatilans]|uniref:Glycosyltransferase family 4 protein n=1 Tax=Achromobacter seleniivolatilans TaxID=3047478 RepID=A0ABY9LX77_9BURK|nr:glycosyltransferase family 4 protein [Achromobacter sp. R39]WMD19376.1 glycosyltransferase family 4 protein [Achromobacter sp. R39]
MKILIVTQYFWPEQFFVNDFVRALVAQGHVVEVLTGKPNYPDGKVFDGYDERGCTQERLNDGTVIHRVPLRARRQGGGKNLVLNYLSFVVNGLRFGHRAVRGKDFDVILAVAFSPITSVIPAIYLKWRLRRPLSIWIQDLWPESLSATGFVRSRAILAGVGLMVRAIYGAASQLLVQSEAFRAPVARLAEARKIVYYPNSSRDPKAEAPVACAVNPVLLATLESHFCVVFAGNLGTAQSLHTVLAAARKVRELGACKIVLVGSGSMSGQIREQVEREGLDNVVLAGRYPNEQMPHIFDRAGALLVTLKRDAILTQTIPSKVQAYLAAGRPIIGALDGAGAEIINASGGGLVCAAEDADGLADCIGRMYAMDAGQRGDLGAAGRAYYLEHFEIGRQARRLVSILSENMNSH